VKTDLLRQLRHELRTPINHIVGYSELWLEEADELDLPELNADLQRIRAAGRELLGMVADQLAADRPGADGVDLNRLERDLRTPLNAVIGYSELLREEATSQAPATMLADVEKIRGAAVHLLNVLDTVALLEHGPHTDAETLEPSPSTNAAGSSRPHDVVGTQAPSTILVVDDNSMNRDLLSRRLDRLGYIVRSAENGREALDELASGDVDLVLLDIMMPEMDGFEVLEHRRADPHLQEVPFIVLSALDELESVVRCIELGAEDYLTKPFNPVLLRARIESSLERKMLHDREREFTRLLAIERERSERLLLNVLPASIAERLKAGEGLIADRLPEVTALFSDLVGFTELSLTVSPADMVQMLNRMFSAFDSLVEEHGVEKIKTSGDGYVVLGGAPAPMPGHAGAVAELALGMREVVESLRHETGWPLDIRIGIDTGGPVVGGVVGRKKFFYDVWGDTINTASRMESHGVPGQIQVTQATYDRLRDAYEFEERGKISVKGKGTMRTYFLLCKQASASAADPGR
jgi:class 3 adenylate cyclase